MAHDERKQYFGHFLDLTSSCFKGCVNQNENLNRFKSCLLINKVNSDTRYQCFTLVIAKPGKEMKGKNFVWWGTKEFPISNFTHKRFLIIVMYMSMTIYEKLTKEIYHKSLDPTWIFKCSHQHTHLPSFILIWSSPFGFSPSQRNLLITKIAELCW